MTTNNTNPTYAPQTSRLSWRAIVGVALLALVGWQLYGYWQGEQDVAQPAPVTIVQQAANDLIGNTVKIGVVDNGCTVNCANEIELTVTNAHSGFVWLADNEGDTFRCLPSVMTPGVLHPMAEPVVADGGTHPGVPITWDGRSKKPRQLQMTVMDSAKCEFAYTDMLFRGRNGLSATLNAEDQAKLDESERYCYNNPDSGCELGKNTRNFVDGLVDGLAN